MAPLNWLSLFISFVFIFFLFNSLNYFSFKYNSKPSNFKKKIKKINWKW